MLDILSSLPRIRRIRWNHQLVHEHQQKLKFQLSYLQHPLNHQFYRWQCPNRCITFFASIFCLVLSNAQIQCHSPYSIFSCKRLRCLFNLIIGTWDLVLQVCLYHNFCERKKLFFVASFTESSERKRVVDNGVKAVVTLAQNSGLGLA